MPLEKSSPQVSGVRWVHWDHVRVIVSLLYKVARKLLCVPSVLLRSEAAKDAELLVLRHENAVLRRQLAGPVRYEPADRFWFAVLSTLVPRRRWREVFPVTPGTLLAWHRRFMGGGQDARPAAGPGESEVGTQADPGEVGPTRAPDRRFHGLGDTERRGRRPGAASYRPDLT